jgi:hypothetical protein
MAKDTLNLNGPDMLTHAHLVSLGGYDFVEPEYKTKYTVVRVGESNPESDDYDPDGTTIEKFLMCYDTGSGFNVYITEADQKPSRVKTPDMSSLVHVNHFDTLKQFKLLISILE